MNLHRSKHEWEKVAQDMQYPSIRALLFDCYVDKRYTTTQLGDLLGIGKDRAAQLLRRHDIPLRPRGGVR